MSIINKVQFWKRSDLDDLDLGLGEPSKLDMNSGLPPQDPLQELPQRPVEQFVRPQFESQFEPERPRYQPQQPTGSPKDLEMISVKLDTIRAMVENISQRLEMLERGRNQDGPRRGGW